MTTERRLQTIEETLRIVADSYQVLTAKVVSHDDQIAFIHETNRIASETHQIIIAVQAAQQERLTDHEQEMALIRETNQTLSNMLAAHEARQDDHAQQLTDHDQGIAFNRETNIMLAEVSRDIAAMLASHDERMASIQRDAQRTKRAPSRSPRRQQNDPATSGSDSPQDTAGLKTTTCNSEPDWRPHTFNKPIENPHQDTPPGPPDASAEAPQ